MKIKLTPAFVASAAAPLTSDRIIYWDEALPCFGLMVTKNGRKSFVVQYRAHGVSRRLTFKTESTGGLSLDKARREAKAVIGAVTKGGDPLIERRRQAQAAENTLRSVAEEYMARKGSKHRTHNVQRANLKRLVFPTLGARQITDIRRSDIIRLMDKIADERGPVMADKVLSILRTIMSWHEKRTDDFNSPIRKGMSRTSQAERSRDRILTDDELRSVWRAVEAQPTLFGRYAQFLLLTAARRNEAAQMQQGELSGNVWTIPGERYKTGLPMLLPLSSAARKVLESTPRVGAKFVFTHDGKRALSGFSKQKARFDSQCGVTGWTLHDLRRTARSLMSRAGVSSDHAERCLGHVMGRIRGTYDRHGYLEEKRHAFEALAGLIERIIDPQTNVTPLRA
jgi:integrase